MIIITLKKQKILELLFGINSKSKKLFKGDFKQSLSNLENLLLEVLEGRLSDVPLGVFLSEG